MKVKYIKLSKELRKKIAEVAYKDFMDNMKKNKENCIKDLAEKLKGAKEIAEVAQIGSAYQNEILGRELFDMLEVEVKEREATKEEEVVLKALDDYLKETNIPSNS
jgi:hypothetical protein